MDIRGIPLIVVMFLVTIILASLYCLFRPYRDESIIVEDEEVLRDILYNYSEDERLKIHNIRNLGKSYAEITYTIKYKRNLRNLHNLEEVSKVVMKIDYYSKL